MKLKLDFSLDDCVIVISEDGDMSLSYYTPAGDFEMTLCEEIVTEKDMLDFLDGAFPCWKDVRNKQ